MDYKYEVIRRSDICEKDLTQMHALRARVFKGRLGWDVDVSNDKEIDSYDRTDAWYMLMRNERDEVCGCWRILTTMLPYMLADTFQQLLPNETAQRDPSVWELSRFAMDGTDGEGYGFSDAARGAMRALITWGIGQEIREFVTVTTTAIERLLKHLGVKSERLGDPKKIGVAKAVALRLPLSEETLNSLLGNDRFLA
jgi:acyl homoserine lactone synthase